MLDLLTAKQIKQADTHTIAAQYISSAKLMERAANAFVRVLTDKYPERDNYITVYCGTGNNGGDGLAIARLLKEGGYNFVSVRIARFNANVSADFQINLERLSGLNIPVSEFHEINALTEDTSDIVIDALLGSGLSRALEGNWKELAHYINSLRRTVVAVDIPTGFPSDGPFNADNPVIKAKLAVTFQRPKINFLLPESAEALESFVVVDIGLDEGFIQKSGSPYLFLTEEDIQNKILPRHSFSHKGTYGHALVVAGNSETMGAALLCAEACLFSGAGLTTACIPADGLTALNTRAPEVMALLRHRGVLPKEITWEKYQAVAIGPGLGTSKESRQVLEEVLKRFKGPLVIDADAINLISSHYELMSLVPAGAVFTPHVKEFDRLFGKHVNWWERLQTGRERAQELGCVIVLKNRYSIIFNPDGNCIFNPSGHPAMASGGMGDTLTGMIVSFMAQGYSSDDAALISVYLHGKTGECLASEHLRAVIPAGELIREIPKTIARISVNS